MPARKKKIKQFDNQYAFNKTAEPYPELSEKKSKPPISKSAEDTTNLFPPKPKQTNVELAKEMMNEYRKAERAVVVNFYTGGSAYKKGIMDAIYRGKNPLNP